MPWEIELTDDGSFSISSDAPGLEPDKGYDRQQRINDRLGGRMVAIYIGPEMEVPAALLTEVSTAGFEALLVTFKSAEDFAVLIAEVEEYGLWDLTYGSAGGKDAILMTTAFGFRWISTAFEFCDWLPAVDEVEYG